MSTQASRHGNSGKQVRAYANVFQLQLPKESKVIYHFDVEISPQFESKKEFKLGAAKCTEVITHLQTIMHPEIFEPKAAYDGKKNLYSIARYNFDSMNFLVPLNLSNKPSKNPRMLTVKITYAASINMNVLVGLIQGNVHPQLLQANSAATTALNILNIFVQAAPRLQYPATHNARAFFFSSGSDRYSGFELWKGLFQSVRPAPSKLIINIDSTVGVVIPARPLESLAADLLRLNNVRDLSNLAPPDYQKLRSLLKSVKVNIDLVKHRGKKPKKITDVVQRVGEKTFDKDSVQITIAEYFKQTYNVDIPRGSLGIAAGDSGIFPMKVCQSVVQLYRGRPPPDVVAKAMQFIPQNPTERMKDVQIGWEQLGYSQSYFLQGAGINIAPTPISAPGRLLPVPRIRFLEPREPIDLRRPGVWDVMRKKLLRPAEIPTWTVINFGASQIDILNRFINDLADALIERGIRMSRDPAAVLNVSGGDIVNSLETCHKNTKATLIIAILPENAAPLYNAVKRYGDITRGVVTQCVKWSFKIYRNYSQKGVNQYHNNLILKINGKCGGINGLPECEAMKWLGKAPTMVLGADVSHPGPGSSLPSVTALVSSYDEHFCNYVASTRVQRSRTEMISDLEEMVVRALGAFAQRNAKYAKPGAQFLPRRLIFYRDGVSEGEFETVRKNEIEVSIAGAITKCYGPDQKSWPGLTFIIVGKRHHIRFAPQGDSLDPQGNQNCYSGFVVDREVVNPIYKDFYLISQSGLKGTSRPSHYTVIWDDNIKQADGVQELSYAFCHCYARATRAVSIPAPVYYAHLVCRRAKFHFDEEVNYSDNMSSISGDTNVSSQLQYFKDHFSDINDRLKNTMYFL